MPRKKKETQEVLVESTEDFIVVTGTAAPPTSGEAEYSVDKEIERLLLQAMKSYDIKKKQSSVYMDNTGSYNTPTSDELAELAVSPQDDLKKILRINSIIGKYVNLDDLIGMVAEAIRVNLNDDIRLAYKKIDGRNLNKKMERAKSLVESFNEDISIKRIIREQIPRAYLEGTSIMYLRQSPSGWTIDTYPLGVAIISPYSVAGDPVVLIDMNELKRRLNKMGYRTRGGKNMFFESIEGEIKENFPEEVYLAYINKEPYAKLDSRYSGVVRVGNYGRKYGVSPIFKAIGSSMILETFRDSDMKNAKARGKKMVYQILDPKLLGEKGEKNPLQQQAFAHSELVAAYQTQGSVLYTAPGYVKEIGVLEPKGAMIDKDTILHYTHKEMSALGIGFLTVEANASVSAAKISLEQLMRNINSISRSLEEVFEKFYRAMLIDEGSDPAYAPSISILDSEALEFDLRAKIVTLLYSTLNCSLQTALEILNIDFEEEVNRRQTEEAMKLSEIFRPRLTSFTTGGDSDKDNGRPKGEENGKQTYDEDYNQQR